MDGWRQGDRRAGRQAGAVVEWVDGGRGGRGRVKRTDGRADGRADEGNSLEVPAKVIIFTKE